MFGFRNGLETGRAPSFATVYGALYPHKKVPETYASWRFGDCPFPSALLAITRGEETVGYHGMNLLPLLNGEIAALTLDALVLEEFQGYGAILASLAELEVRAARENALWILGFCNRRIVPLLERAFGWKRLETLPIWQCRLDNPRTPSLRLVWREEVCSVAGPILNLLWQAYPRDGRGLSGFQRQPQYLSWRFGRSPWRKYHMMVARDSGGATVGCLVTKPYLPEGAAIPEVDLVEWAVAPGVPIGPFIESVCAHLHSTGFRTVSTWQAVGELEPPLLEQLGFAQIVASHFLMGKCLSAGNVASTTWRLRMGDAEMF